MSKFVFLSTALTMVAEIVEIVDAKEELVEEQNSPHLLLSLGAFHSFMASHNKSYVDRVEYKRRYRVFRQNMKKVQLLRLTEQGSAIYGATPFADLSEDEFKNIFLGLGGRKEDDDLPDIEWPVAEIPAVPLPRSFDWRDHGAVTPVKNQGRCGSCWAFSVTGNVEGLNKVKNGKLISLSEQELIDCDKLDMGCHGGLMENAYETLLKLGGLETEKDYGYDAVEEACQFNRSKVAVRVTGGVEIPQDEKKMAQFLVQNGPFSVALNSFPMQFYMGGVSHPFSFFCNPSVLDHAVLVVGFGVHITRWLRRRQPYWIIKNTWGSSWGEKGYYRLYRGQGVCGVNLLASSATI